MVFYDEITDESEIGKEKAKARELRRSSWWLNRIHPGICFYCNRDVGRANLTMDHIVPLSRGGKSKKGNIVPACKDCNSKKKYLLPIEWEEYLQTLSTKSPQD
jgi:5-methylcytosine-specific restriction enzyme A